MLFPLNTKNVDEDCQKTETCYRPGIPLIPNNKFDKAVFGSGYVWMFILVCNAVDNIVPQNEQGSTPETLRFSFTSLRVLLRLPQ